MNDPPAQTGPSQDHIDAHAVVTTLLGARTAGASAGNRRALFARMDELLATADGVPGEAAAVATPPVAQGGEAVRLSRMRLRNWKSFERADLVLPDEGASRPLMIVGGPNGFGKTSILEAFAFGLFGRRAVSDIGFLLNAAGGRGGKRRSYRIMLERSLHRSERARNEGMCAIELEFQTADGPIGIERKWYFDDTGGLIDEDEELLVRIGEDRHLLEAPVGVPAHEWFQEEIERRVMPAGLAPFFIFDGEQVERWADRKLSDQVRTAIGRMLGLDELAGLADDLRAYARDRERRMADDAPTAIATLIAEIERTQAELVHETEALTAVEGELAAARKERDELVATVSSAGGGSHASMQTLLEEEHRLAAELSRAERELVAAIAEGGPLALAGEALAARLVSELQAEAQHDASTALDPDALEPLWTRFLVGGPALDDGALATVRQHLEAAWTQSDDEPRDAVGHAHLDSRTRRLISTRLGSGVSAARRSVAEAHAAARDLEARLAATRESMAVSRIRDRRIGDAQGRLAEVAGRIEELEGVRGSHRRHAATLSEALDPRRTELEQRLSTMREAEPRARAASAARALASMVETHTERLAEGEHTRFAAAVTSSYRSLAHKNQVSRIDIAADGTVAMSDERGRDLTDYRLSAGESQLFAMALIAAVGELVGDRLPLIVDTPLGRLDTKHRQSVLAMLGRRTAQTILLTQPEEITALHLATIASSLAGSVTLGHHVDAVSGVGVSGFEGRYDPASESAA